MSIQRITVATSVAVNDDAAASKWSRKPYPRRLRSIGLAGSTNPNDWGIQVRVEGAEFGDFYNLKAGANTMPDRDTTYGVNIPIPANFLIELIVLDAPGTNSGIGILEFVP